MRAQLIPQDGGKPLSVDRDLMLVGRGEECDLRLDHKSVSKIHCILAKTDGLLFLRDLGSTNGTRVNGQRVRRAALLPNDRVAFAGFVFQVALGPDEMPAVQEYRTQQIDALELAALLRSPSDVEERVVSPASPHLPDTYSENGS